MIGLYSIEEDPGTAINAVQTLFGAHASNPLWEQMPIATEHRGLAGGAALMPVASISARVRMMSCRPPLVPGRWTFRFWPSGRHTLVAMFGMPIQGDVDSGSLVFTAILAANELRKGYAHEATFRPFFREFPNLLLPLGVRCLPTTTDRPLEGLTPSDLFAAP